MNYLDTPGSIGAVVPPFMYDALGFRVKMTGPYSFAEVALDLALINDLVLSVAVFPPSIVAKLPLLLLLADKGIATVDSHSTHSYLYGLLANPATGVDLLGYTRGVDY